MDALIRYVCVETTHARITRTPVIGDLAVHQGSWAFCPADERSGHSWTRVQDVTVEGLAPFGLDALRARSAG